MNEVELKSVVPDPAAVRASLAEAGATLVYAGQLEDRRYDTPDRALAGRDHVLRVRLYRDPGGARASIDWKGASGVQAGYKVREELSADVVGADALVAILDRLGYVVSREIDREIEQYDVGGTMVRIERYPRMDVLVEIEGTTDGIERAIRLAGLPRRGFSADRLTDFVRRYEQRTGNRAALSARELTGDYRYGIEDA